MRKITTLFFVLILFLSCKQHDTQIQLAVTSSLLPAFQELTTKFNTKNNTHLTIVSSSSGNLSNQIVNGAPFDIFFSADDSYCLFIKEQLKLFNASTKLAKGTLVKVTNTKLLHNQDWHTANRIAIANPKIAPYGAATVDFLNTTGLYNNVKAQLVFGQNVNQVLQYLITESVPVAFLSKSTALQASLDPSKYTIEEINIEKQPEIIHTYLVLNTNKTLDIFLRYLKSEEAKAILTKYGYVPL